MPGAEESGDWVVGDKIKPDRSLDLSRAVKPLDQERWNRGASELRARERAQRQERLAIPVDARPGTASRDWNELRKTVMINAEAAAGINAHVAQERVAHFNMERDRV